jgi:hypothetical protein
LCALCVLFGLFFLSRRFGLRLHGALCALFGALFLLTRYGFRSHRALCALLRLFPLMVCECAEG